MCGGKGGCLVTEGGEPVDVGFAAEPGELAFGVVAMALLGGGDGFFAGEFGGENLAGLAVAKGVENGDGRAVAGDDGAGLLYEAVCEHGGGACVDTVVERGSRRVESDAQDAVAGEGIASCLPCGADGLAGGEADLDGADELGVIVGVDARGGYGVESVEDAMEPAGGLALGAASEAGAGFCGAGRAWEETVHECAEVEAGATGDDGEVMAGGDLGDGTAREAGVITGGADIGGGKYVDEVVGDLCALGGGGFGGADFAFAVDGDGVATDDFAVEAMGEGERERGFSAGGWTEEQNEQGIGVCGGAGHPMRHHPGAKRACLSARRKAMRRMSRARRIRPRT